jgi:hypothetical protein
MARFAEALGGADDPVSDYIFSLGKRVDMNRAGFAGGRFV